MSGRVQQTYPYLIPSESGCCGITEFHAHLCDLGPAGWFVRRVLRWLAARRPK